MRKNLVYSLVLFVVLMGVLGVSFNVHEVKAGGTITIKADGSVDPPTAPITTADNVTYTFTGNISDAIVVKRSNIIVDGNGYTLEGYGRPEGFWLAAMNNVTIRNTNIKGFGVGISVVFGSHHNTISGNNITANGIIGIQIGLWDMDDTSNNNMISGNNITANNEYGIYIGPSNSHNTISGNNITEPREGLIPIPYGIFLGENSGNNIISGNNIVGLCLKGIGGESSSYNTISGNNITNNVIWGSPYDPFNTLDGIYLVSSSYNTISGNNITANHYGIWISPGSHYNTISGNNVTNNVYGILSNPVEISGGPSNNNIISGNNITRNRWHGIMLRDESSNNTISGNTIRNSYTGITLYESSNNTFYHNNLINNAEQVYTSASKNFWDDGYPSGGNYWSDFEERYPDVEDIFSGPYQNETESDGIWDHPYEIDADNQDRYPLMNPLDTIPPTTASDYDGLWHTTDFTITLTATDDISGVAETYYEINDGPTKNVSVHGQPYITSESSSNKLEYWSMDVANNKESHHILTGIKLDKTQPTTTDNYDGLWHTTDFMISLTASDSLSGLAETCYKINDGSTKIVDIDGQPFITTEGDNNTLEYWSVDLAGNEETPHNVLTNIQLDKTAPSGSIIINNENAYTTLTSVTLSLSASDATSSVSQMQFSNDEINWTLWEAYAVSKVWALTTNDGTKTVYVRFKDSAGLVSSTFSDTIILDTTPPTGSISINADATYTTSTSATLTLTYGDATSGASQVRYSNDGVWDTESWEPPSTTKIWILTSGDGTKTVYYQVRDNAGLVSDTYSDTIVLDTNLPTILITSPSNGTEIRSSTATATWSGADETSGIDHYEIRLDDGSWINTGTNATYTFSGIGDGSHTIETKAYDKAGLSKHDNVDFIVNTSPLLGPGYTEEAVLLATAIIAAIGIALYFFKIRRH